MTKTTREDKSQARHSGNSGGAGRDDFNKEVSLAGPVPGANGLVARVRFRIQAGVAELLLVNRLKARTRGISAASIPARAAHILAVTCKSWFSSGTLKEQQRSRPP